MGVDEYRAVTDDVAVLTAEVPPARPVFEAGDAAIFDQFLLHQTAASPDLQRTALRLRIVVLRALDVPGSETLDPARLLSERMPSAVQPAALPEQGAGSPPADRSAASHAPKRVASPSVRNAPRCGVSASMSRSRSPSSCSTSGGITGSSVTSGAFSPSATAGTSEICFDRTASIGSRFRSSSIESSSTLFGLRSYVPYQSVVVVAHLTTAVLLRVVMRRAGVSPWTATIVAAVFVLFGPGEENIVWAFQFTFVGALMFGLVHLILSDHDGPIDRRDQLGLLAGVASLMCSGVSLVLVAVVGLAVVVRRGWRPAVFHTAPLGVLYAIWFLTTDPGGIDNPYGRSANARELLRFIWSGARGDFRAIGASRPFGFLIAGLLVARRGAVLAPLRWQWVATKIRAGRVACRGSRSS